jgi:hypothetical protein
MKEIEKTKAMLLQMRDDWDKRGDLCPMHLESYAEARRNARACMEAVILVDLVKAFVAGDQRITRDHLVNFLNKETMK